MNLVMLKYWYYGFNCKHYETDTNHDMGVCFTLCMHIIIVCLMK